jgi:hypothetical protein
MGIVMHTQSTDAGLINWRNSRQRLAGLVGVAAVLALAACDRASQPLEPTDALAPLAQANQQIAVGTQTVFATGLNNPRGLRFGSDGYLYVAEAGAGGTVTTTSEQCTQVPGPVGPYAGGNTAQITKISSAGINSVVASGLPSAVNAMGFVSGISDVEFMGGTLYALVDGAGCSHGHPEMPNSVVRINADGSWTQVADLSAFYQSHPTINFEPSDFEPDGTPYSMVGVRGDLYVVEPNHGSLDRVSLDGTITRVADISATYGHIVPTTVSYNGNFFVGNLHTFPVVAGSSQITKITPSGQVKIWASGVTAVLGSAWDGRGRYYVLETTTLTGAPTPFTGRVRRIDPSGAITTIADGLFFPTSMTMGPDRNLYVSNFGFGPPPVGLGTIVKIQLN